MIFVKSWCFSPPPLSLSLSLSENYNICSTDLVTLFKLFLTTLFLNECPNVSEHCYLWRRINAAF